MILALVPVGLALALPWCAAPAVRRLAALLAPRQASVVLAGAGALLAGGTVAALVGLFHVPFLARLERIPLHTVAAAWPLVLPVSAVAGVVLAVQAVVLVRRWCEHRRLLDRAWASVRGAAPDGDVLVVRGSAPEAFALPGFRGRGGRVVVTTGMLGALGPAEREVLFAHERTHLAGRHHLLSVIAYLAAAVHPALRPLRPDLDFHLERWADETAAAAVDSRKRAATAIARAALAAAPAGQPPRGLGALASVGSGPVPRRVQALLAAAPSGPGGRRGRAAVAGLGAAVVVSALMGLLLAYGLHEYVELAAAGLRGA
ncbi:M56 family metallopeptidase [Kitasatospora sp. NPDC048540]|uniref:M56 family metallopeptidase n=1 Tax=unclassified Kitasatospora TaxID=2633591 RepID=UPI00069259C0|nr:M56 family metallopeptidase [Kitasatospora sp. MBT63]